MLPRNSLHFRVFTKSSEKLKLAGFNCSRLKKKTPFFTLFDFNSTATQREQKSHYLTLGCDFNNNYSNKKKKVK